MSVPRKQAAKWPTAQTVRPLQKDISLHAMLATSVAGTIQKEKEDEGEKKPKINGKKHFQASQVASSLRRHLRPIHLPISRPIPIQNYIPIPLRPPLSARCLNSNGTANSSKLPLRPQFIGCLFRNAPTAPR
jgi:hypothetical protein